MPPKQFQIINGSLHNTAGIMNDLFKTPIKIVVGVLLTDFIFRLKSKGTNTWEEKLRESVKFMRMSKYFLVQLINVKW